jgi:hypothetical protein
MLLLLLLLQLPMRFRSREDASGRRLHEALFCVAFPPPLCRCPSHTLIKPCSFLTCFPVLSSLREKQYLEAAANQVSRQK